MTKLYAGYFFWGLSLSQNNEVGGYPVGVVGCSNFVKLM